MRRLSAILILFTTSVVLASQVLTVEDFQKHEEFDYVYVTKAEKVFYDEMQDESVYEVTYEVEGECAAAGEFDACEMVPYCEYFRVDEVTNDIEGTQVSCDKDIEEVIGEPIIWDEP